MKTKSIVMLFALVAFALTAFASTEKEVLVSKDELSVKTEKLSLDYTYDLTRKIAAKQIEDFILDYIRIQDAMIANPQVSYITDYKALNPTGCPPQCGPTMTTDQCYHTHYKYCGAEGGPYCLYCIYMGENYMQFHTCAWCHWGGGPA